jgi:hypothetical protein
MAKIINFLCFWALMTWSISRGDLVGIGLCMFGFLLMHTLCEDLVDNSQNLL